MQLSSDGMRCGWQEPISITVESAVNKDCCIISPNNLAS
jgi:hypothetical protein